MNRQLRIALVIAPLVLLTGPAVWWLRSEDAPLQPLLYYAAVGVAATFGLLWWYGRELTSHGSRRRGRQSSRRELMPMKGLGLGPSEEHYEEAYPDLAGKIEIINRAIVAEADLVFVYDDGGKGAERRVQPTYLHEYKSSRGGGQVTLCVNAYYYKRQNNVNFSVKRMSKLRVETA